MLPAGEKIVLVLEAIGDDKIRVNSSSLDHPLTILDDQAGRVFGRVWGRTLEHGTSRVTSGSLIATALDEEESLHRCDVRYGQVWRVRKSDQRSVEKA